MFVYFSVYKNDGSSVLEDFSVDWGPIGGPGALSSMLEVDDLDIYSAKVDDSYCEFEADLVVDSTLAPIHVDVLWYVCAPL